MAEIGYSLMDALFEGGFHENRFFQTCTMHNNQYGVSWVILGSLALDTNLRAKLVEESCGGVSS